MIILILMIILMLMISQLQWSGTHPKLKQDVFVVFIMEPIILWSVRLFGWNSMNSTADYTTSRSKTNNTREQISRKHPHRKAKGSRQHPSSTRILGYGFIVVTVVVIIIGRLHEVVSRIAASKETTRSYIK